LVHASKTSLLGASTTRVMTISWSDRVVNVVTPTLFAVAICSKLASQKRR